MDDLSARTERILQKMDEQGISNRKLRRSVEKVKDESLPKLVSYKRHMESWERGTATARRISTPLS